MPQLHGPFLAVGLVQLEQISPIGRFKPGPLCRPSQVAQHPFFKPGAFSVGLSGILRELLALPLCGPFSLCHGAAIKGQPLPYHIRKGPLASQPIC